jgi:6-phosphofructokinase 2
MFLSGIKEFGNAMRQLSFMVSGRVLTLSLNPAVDMCTSVGRIEPFHKLRCGDARRDPGGGGINVARVIRRLGGDTVALFPAGGPIGRLLEKLLAAEDVKFTSLPISGDTREDLTIDETATGAQFRFVLPGPDMIPAEIERVVDAMKSHMEEAEFLVASGSLPPGVPQDFYARVGQLARAAGVKFILDSSGPALAAALDHDVYMIKPSLRELGELTGEALAQEPAWLGAARSLVTLRRVEWVALTLGEMGALLVGRDLVLRASAPKIVPVSTVGAGDSFLGAMVCALANGQDMRGALRLAIASGTAAMLARGTDLAHAADSERLSAMVQIDEI